MSVWDLVLNIDGASELAYLQMLATIQPLIFDQVWHDVYHDTEPCGYYGFTLHVRVSQCLIDFVHLEINEEL